MRGALAVVLLLTLTAGPALGTPPAPPFVGDARLDAAPVAGRAVTLTVVIEARDADARAGRELALELPDWVSVAEPRAFQAPGEDAPWRIERSWTVTPTRPGFWAARVAFADEIEAFCCVRAWSGADDGAWTDEHGAFLPGADLRSAFSAQNGTARWSVTGRSGWAADARIEARMFSVMDARVRDVEEGNGSASAALTLPLDPGERGGVRLWGDARATFDTGGDWFAPGDGDALDCAVADVERREDGGFAWSEVKACSWPSGLPRGIVPIAALVLVATAGAFAVWLFRMRA